MRQRRSLSVLRQMQLQHLTRGDMGEEFVVAIGNFYPHIDQLRPQHGLFCKRQQMLRQTRPTRGCGGNGAADPANGGILRMQLADRLNLNGDDGEQVAHLKRHNTGQHPGLIGQAITAHADTQPRRGRLRSGPTRPVKDQKQCQATQQHRRQPKPHRQFTAGDDQRQCRRTAIDNQRHRPIGQPTIIHHMRTALHLHLEVARDLGGPQVQPSSPDSLCLPLIAGSEGFEDECTTGRHQPG